MMNAHPIILATRNEVNMHSDRLEPPVETAISFYTDYLNWWHKHNDDEDAVVSRDMYDLATQHDSQGNQYPDDSPRILSSMVDVYSGLRTIFIYTSPYHDEGGPSILIATYENYNRYVDDDLPPQWELLGLLCYFDTMLYPIVMKDTLTNGLKLCVDDPNNKEAQ